jgi:hypothetical protein
MNVEIGAEAALFPEKEYINGIAVAVCLLLYYSRRCSSVAGIISTGKQKYAPPPFLLVR